MIVAATFDAGVTSGKLAELTPEFGVIVDEVENPDADISHIGQSHGDSDAIGHSVASFPRFRQGTQCGLARCCQSCDDAVGDLVPIMTLPTINATTVVNALSMLTAHKPEQMVNKAAVPNWSSASVSVRLLSWRAKLFSKSLQISGRERLPEVRTMQGQPRAPQSLMVRTMSGTERLLVANKRTVVRLELSLMP